MRQLTYLACPYSHADPSVRLKRFEAVNRAASILMGRGHLIFSPISHTHPIALAGALPLGWEFWREFDRAFLEASRMVIVLCLDGWRDSVGVGAELSMAKELGLEIEFMKLTDSGDVVDLGPGE